MKFILYRLREIPIFPRKHPAQRWSDAMLKMVERDVESRSPTPYFRVTGAFIAPYISMYADEPDGVELTVIIRGVSPDRHKK